MYIDTVPNRSSPPAVLLRESTRHGNKIVKRTLANLSDWPPPKVDLLRRVLKGETLVAASEALRYRSRLATRPRRRHSGHAAPHRAGANVGAHALGRTRSGIGLDRGPHPDAGLEAGDRARVGGRNRRQFTRRLARARGRGRRSAVCGHGLADSAPGADGRPTCAAASGRRLTGALRPYFDVLRRPQVPAGRLGPLAR